jgi:hypothetical protein
MLGDIARPTLQNRVLVFSYRPSPLYSWVYESLDSLQRRVYSTGQGESIELEPIDGRASDFE